MWSKQIKSFRIVLITILNLFSLSSAQYNDVDVLSTSPLNREPFVQFNQIKDDNQRQQQTANQTPTNFTVEIVHFNSVRLRWNPPLAKEFAVLQYKIKFEKLNSNKHDTRTVDAKLHAYLLENLDTDSEYRFRIGAVFVNDNLGPFTKWKQVQTLKELDETHVPPKPEYLIATAKSTRIQLRWSAPSNRSIRIREYLLNFGVNYPDINPLTIDANHNEYTIKDLQPKQEYVIMLRANNKFGAGEAIYTTVKTLPREDDELAAADDLDEDEDENRNKLNDQDADPETVVDQEQLISNQLETTNNKLSPHQVPKPNPDNTLDSLVNHEIDPELLPPLGVKAEVLSSNKVRVSWTDQAKKDQSYMIKFNSLVDKTSKGKVRLLNTSDNHILIDELKPFTKYEFAVKMIKRNRASTWSMSVLNTTSEALPACAPRDLVVMPVSNLMASSGGDPLLTNRITNDPSQAGLLEQPDNKLTELAYTGSGSLSKQATMKRAKSAISRTGKYRNKFKSTIGNKNSLSKYAYEDDETGEDDEPASDKSPNSQNYVQYATEASENERQQIDLDSDKIDINLFDKQAVPGLSAVSLR